MSASNQKKIRQQEREIYRSERERQEALEAKKLRKQTIAFVLVIAICLSVFLGSFAVSPIKNVLFKNTIAVTVGNHDLTAVDVNYFYIDAINNYLNQYYYYIYLGYIKLDMSTALNKQVVDSKTGETWADSFLAMAVENIKSTYGLYDLAMKADHKLTDEEQAELDGMEASLKETAKSNGFKTVKAMLQSSYGNGATLESYMSYYEICTYANSFYTAYQESLEYDDATLREYEGKEGYKYNSYTYSHYLINVSDFLPKLDKDQKHTEEQTKAAEAACKEFAERLAAGEFATVEDFDAAIDAAIKELKGENKTDDNNGTATQDEAEDEEILPDEDEDGDALPEEGDETEEPKEEEKPNLKYTSTKQDDLLYSSVNSLFKDWIIGKLVSEEETDSDDKDDKDKEDKFETRNEGDMTVIEYTTGSGDTKAIKGYYVVRYESCNDNAYALANIRHILVKFKGGKTNSSTGVTTYTDAEKNAAKASAEKLYADFKAGTISEDAFASLAQLHSDDGNKSEGGLYEDVYPGQMVTSFNDWCFDEARQPGDHGLIETEYGWHLMYYCSDSETTYRDYMVSNDKRSEDMTEWFEGIIEDSKYTEKNLKFVLMDKILGL